MFKKKSKKEEETVEGAEKEEATAAAPAPEGEEAEAAEGEEGGEKKGKRKLVLIAGGAVLLAAIVGGLFASGILGGDGDKEHEVAQAVDEHGNPIIDKPVYYELPEFLVNLTPSPTSGGRVSFLKMSVTLELKDQGAVAIIEANKPRIIDTFTTYLHELRPADVQGSAGIYRLRDELMARLNGTVQEGLVKDILFSEIIVQ